MVVTLTDLKTVQAGLFLHDFSLMRRENLHHFLNFGIGVWFNTMWHTWSVVALFVCCGPVHTWSVVALFLRWGLAKIDTLALSATCLNWLC